MNTRGVVVAASVVIAASLAATGGLLTDVDHTTSSGLASVAVVVGMLLAAAFPVTFQRNGHEQTYSSTTVVLAVGLPTVGPVVVVLAALAGTAVHGAIARREPFKVYANLAVAALETATAGLVYAVVAGADPGEGVRLWGAVIAAALAYELIGLVTVGWFISLFTRTRWSLSDDNALGALASLFDAGLGIAALVLWRAEPLSVFLLAGVPATLVLGYRNHAKLLADHRRLVRINDFTQSISASVGTDEIGADVVRNLATVLDADDAWLVVADGTDASVLRGDGQQQLIGAGSIEAYVHEAAGEDDEARIVQVVMQSSAGADGSTVLVGAVDAVGVRASLAVQRAATSAAWTDADVETFETLAAAAGVALQNGDLVLRLRHEAAMNEHISLHDSLTGLPNRRSFERSLDIAVRIGQPFAVVLLDLDHFKEVNDTLGHDTGDLLLCEIAARCRTIVRQDDVVARLGGDEFAMLLRDVDDDGAAAIAAAVVRRLSAPVTVGELSLNVAASIGLTQFPQDGDSAAVLLQRADVAMYTAKESVGSIEFYDATKDEYTTERLTLVADLRSAIAAGEIDLVWQPQVDLVTGRVVGVEALARWTHAERGSVSPMVFVAAAERTGVITELTRYVLEHSAAQAARWSGTGHPLRVSVNLSARNLREPDLPEFVADLLARHEIDASALAVEITETAAMTDPDATMATLEALHGLGVEISVDDFGTGHSSLVYLQRLPLAEVKVDREFVAAMVDDPGAASIVRAVLGLGRELGLLTVAEGVEDARTADAVLAAGCAVGQGYHWAAPMTVQDLEDFLRNRSRRSVIQ